MPPRETSLSEPKSRARALDEDARALALARPLLAPHLRRIAGAVCERGESPEIAIDAAVRAQVEAALVDWLDRVSTGLGSRLELGHGVSTHVAVIVLSRLRAQLLDLAEDTFGAAPSRPVRRAFGRAIDRELAREVSRHEATELRARNDRGDPSRDRRERLASVGTLAAGFAHEIRNPLNGAHLHLTVLEREMRRAGVTNPEMIDALRVVGAEVQKLGDLVTDFLAFARPGSLHRSLQRVRPLCDRALEALRPEASEAGAKLTLDESSADPEIDVDGPRIEHALGCILQNAIEAVGPSGAGHVRLRVAARPHQAILEVEDDGPGLPASLAPIFDPFFTTKARRKGLGLAIAHRIVTDHGGAIDVESRPGRTLFRVALPRRSS